MFSAKRRLIVDIKIFSLCPFGSFRDVYISIVAMGFVALIFFYLFDFMTWPQRSGAIWGAVFGMLISKLSMLRFVGYFSADNKVEVINKVNSLGYFNVGNDVYEKLIDGGMVFLKKWDADKIEIKKNGDSEYAIIAPCKAILKL